jgi:hypothetical protein
MGTIPQLKWTDRETAARDLLAVANGHEDLQIRQAALNALRGIRFPGIANDLIKIALDRKRNEAERLFALCAFGDLPGNIYAPQLVDLLVTDLAKYTEWVKQYGVESPIEIELPYDSATLGLGNFIPLCLSSIVNNHRSNERWFFLTIDQSDPVVACYFYCQMCLPSLIVRRRVMVDVAVKKVIQLVDAYPQLLDLYVARIISEHGMSDGKCWLNQHINQILPLCTKEDFKDIPWNWRELWDALQRINPTLYHIYAEREARSEVYQALYQNDLHVFERSPLWQHFERISAQADHQQAIGYFGRIALDENIHVVVRAAATHFLGKSVYHKQVIGLLCDILIKGDDSWVELFEPIRYQAAQSLQFTASIEAWEAMVQAFFLTRSFELSFVVLGDLFANLTDRLSGIYLTIDNRLWEQWEGLQGDRRVFGKLPEINVELPPFP